MMKNKINNLISKIEKNKNKIDIALILSFGIVSLLANATDPK